MYPLTPVSDVRLTRNHESVIRVIEKFEGRKFDYRPRNEFEEQYSMYPVEVVERMRNQVSLSAIKAIAVRLGGLREGRKAIVLVSEGYSNYVPPQLRDPNRRDAGHRQPEPRATRWPARTAWPRTGRASSRSVDLQGDMREVYAAAAAPTRPSTRSIRVGWPSSSSTSTRASGCARTRSR